MFYILGERRLIHRKRIFSYRGGRWRRGASTRSQRGAQGQLQQTRDPLPPCSGGGPLRDGLLHALDFAGGHVLGLFLARPQRHPWTHHPRHQHHAHFHHPHQEHWQRPTKSIKSGSDSKLFFYSVVLFAQVSYIKATEVWFIVCTAFIFGSLLEFAFVNTIWRRK